jgi:hypothetical protein
VADLDAEDETRRTWPEYRRVLAIAAELYCTSTDARVPAIFHAVSAVLMRLRESESEERLRPLVILLHDLDRLNAGKRARILRPRKGFTAVFPDLADGVSVVRQAYSLATQEILFRGLGPRSRRKAYSEAAKVLAKLGYKTSKGRLVTGNNLRLWRSCLGNGDARFDQLRRNYLTLEAQIPEILSETEARECAMSLAQSLTAQPGFDLS